MNREDLFFFHSWFTDYVSSYYSEDNYIQMNVKLKEDHSCRVCKNIVKIGRDLHLNEQELLIAETIALFHDIGRFKQFHHYQTFNDRHSENHAELSVAILKQTGILSRLSEDEQTIIYKAISYHNRFTIPTNETEKCLFFTKLIRDADKLDIWSTIIEYYRIRHSHPNPALELELPDVPEYSTAVINDILKGRCTQIGGMKTINDLKILLLSWVFDIYFTPTFYYIQREGYIDDIVLSLPDTTDIQRVRKFVHQYISKKLTGNDQLANTT